MKTTYFGKNITIVGDGRKYSKNLFFFMENGNQHKFICYCNIIVFKSLFINFIKCTMCKTIRRLFLSYFCFMLCYGVPEFSTVMHLIVFYKIYHNNKIHFTHILCNNANLALHEVCIKSYIFKLHLSSRTLKFVW